MVKQRKSSNQSNSNINNNNNSISSSNNNSSSSNNSRKFNNNNSNNNNNDNNNDVFQNIDKIFKEFETNQDETPRPYSKFWDNYWVKKVLRVLEYIFWLSLGGFTAYKTDLVNVVLYSNDVNRFYFNIGVIGLIGFIVLYVYCGYFSKVEDKKTNDDWEKLHPKAIPAATICLITFTIGTIIGLWNIWGLFTPILILIYFASISYLFK